MKTGSIFQQPKYVILPILVEWLLMNDLGALDTAVCNSKERKVFLLWLGGSTTISFSGKLHERYNGARYWQWLNSRNVHVHYVSVYFQKFDQIKVKCRSYWERVYDRTFGISNSQVIAQPEVVLKLPFNVNSLFLCALEDKSMKQLFPLLTQRLISVKLTYFAVNEESHLAELCQFVQSHCSSLKELIVQDCGQIADRILLDVLRKSPDLLHLQLLQRYVPYQLRTRYETKLINFCSPSCVKLLSISFCRLTYVGDPLMLELLPKCPLLQHIMVLQCDVTDDTVNEIARCCPALVSLALEPIIGQISDEPVLAIAAACDHLEYWNVVSRASLSTFQSMMEMCPKLKFLNCGYARYSFGLYKHKHIKIEPDSRLSGWFEPYPFVLPTH